MMKLSIYLLIIYLLTFTSLHAEVALDGTLGSSSALPGPDYAIGAELGQQRGSNLFHSFEQFNLTVDESAIFSGPETIGNIISRVTGGIPSNIDGTIRSTIPNANMYFLNPYGIIFGPNAKLDISGSFHASTADTLRFSDGSQFNARNPSASLLTVAPISAFGFLTDSPQPLSIERSRFTASVGKTFSFIGGTVQISSAIIRASAGRINIAGVASSGNVTLTEQDLTLSSNQEAGDVTIQNALVSVSGGGSSGGIYIRAGQFLVKNATVNANTRDATNAGELNIQANDFIVTEGGRFLSQTTGSGQGGTIKIKVAGLTEFSGESIDSRGTVRNSSISVISAKEGHGGNLELETERLELKDGGYISASAFGVGTGGNITIQATDAITLSGFSSEGLGSSINANTYGEMDNAGRGGTITLETKQLQLTDGSEITSVTDSSGQGGNIMFQVTDNVILSGENSTAYPSRILTTALSSGNAGTLQLTANQLILIDGAIISADSWGAGKGGNIQIQANDLVNIEGVSSEGYGGAIVANSNGEAENTGDSGTIELTTGRLQLSDGGQIGASTFGSGNAGNVKINIAKAVSISGSDQNENTSGIFSASVGEYEEAGDAGSIVLTAENLEMAEGGNINTVTFGPGKAGSIEVNITKEVSIAGESVEGYTSGIFSTSESPYEDAGNAGSITLTAGNLRMDDNGNISVATYGPGAGGNLAIQAQNVGLNGNSLITAYSGPDLEAEEQVEDISYGNAGQLSLAIGNLLIMRDSRIETSAKLSDGGNLIINAPGYAYVRDSQITTSVSEEFGNGGNLTVSPKFVIVDNSQVFAKAKKGAGGNINVTTTGIYNFTGEPISQIISASSEFGVDGIVTINTPDNSAQEGLFTLPADFVDASALMNTACGQRLAENLSSFVLRVSEGTQIVYHDLLPSGPLFTKSLNLTTRAAMNSHNITMPEAFLLMGCHKSL